MPSMYSPTELCPKSLQVMYFLISFLPLNYVREVCAHNHRSPQEREDDIGAGDTGRYEPPDTDARDPTWVLYSELF